MALEGEQRQGQGAASLVDLWGEELLDNITCAVRQYCAEGFDAFDETILTSVPYDEQQAAAVLQGSKAVYASLLASVEQQLGKFRSLALATSLSVPSGHVLEPLAMPGVERCDASAEYELDRQLARLYGEIAKAQAAQQRAEEETEVLEQELRQYGNAAPLAAVVASAAQGKENLAEDAAVIAAKASKLLPLLRHAEAVQQSKQVLQPRSAADVALLAEKEVLKHKAAANGIATDDLRRLQERVGAT